MKTRIFLPVLSILLIAFGYCMGRATDTVEIQEVPVITTQYIQLPTKVKEVIIREVEVITDVVTEVKEVVVPLKEFASPDELAQWLIDDSTNTLPARVTVGRYIISLDCDDYACILQKHALEDGYLLNVQIYGSGTKLPESDRVLKTAHALNSAIIGNGVWLIEPTTDEYWYAYTVDDEPMVRER